MSPAELFWRARDSAVKAAWARRQVRPGQLGGAGPVLDGAGPRFAAVLPPGAADLVPPAARAAALDAAAWLLKGEGEVLGVARTDLVAPDWFLDPVTGRRSPADRLAFRINHRSEEQTGNIKQVWEISRLHHLTVLAAGWFLSGDERYAARVSDQLQSWWQENPFLSGVHWTSGIEVGVRLISLVWIRRLLEGWPGAADLFERNGLAVRQIYWHQQYLAAFRSRGSSANNHVIAEAAGQLAASCAFSWFPESAQWQQQSAGLLERELISNTFPSGIGRELASDYHCFVAELGLVAATEARAVGRPLAPAAWQRLCAMVDSGAAVLDERLRPPRQGDGDEGRALVLDDPARESWPSLLALGNALFGRLAWWPSVSPDVRSTLLGAMNGPAATMPGRPAQRPSRFADAGITLLRTAAGDRPEIWCRCDGGPHGYLSIAAHAHADALSVEVRYGGVDILADPGTFCYHGDPAWRSYFRSTIAHNTAEVGGRNQSVEGGPFLWLQHARTQQIDTGDDGSTAWWVAEHDGYTSLEPSVRHRRSVRLDRRSRSLDIMDEIDGEHDIRLSFHLGPDVQAELTGARAALSWTTAVGPGTAQLALPGELRWSMHRGETDPPLGWYSPRFGQRVPAVTLVGRGRTRPGVTLRTHLQFIQVSPAGMPSHSEAAISLTSADGLTSERLGSRGQETR
jgi:hypothetical protein